MPISLGTTTITALYLGTTSIVSAYLGATQVFGGASAFTPLDLFSTGSQGIWLDPSDLSTMFSDRAGTTAVTTPGTVVGLRLDKSKGLTLGAELVTNGTFDTNVTGWTLVRSSTNGTIGWSADGAVLTLNGDLDVGAYQGFSTVVGKRYTVLANLGIVSNFNTPSNLYGTVSFGVGTGATNWNLAKVSVGDVRNYIGRLSFVATTTTSYFFFRTEGASTTQGSYRVDNISVRELAGNHAVAPTDAARPTYGVEPKGGRRNLLTWSEDLTNAVWATAPGTTVATTADTPSPSIASFAVTETATTAIHSINQSFSFVSGVQYTISVRAKYNGRQLQIVPGSAVVSSGFANFNLQTGVVGSLGGSGLTSAIVDLTGGWYLCSATFTSASTTTTTPTFANVTLATSSRLQSYAGDGVSGLKFAGFQLELGSTATAYQRVTTAYDVTESGVDTCHYVQFDGSDDSMSTAAIDFTSTDKMSVFAGVRKLGDVASGASLTSIIAELGGTNGITHLAGSTGYNTGQKYSFYSKGSVGANAVTTNAAYTAPVSNVLTGLGDISGDRATLRINGSQVAQVTTDQGTGNYGNNPIYIGRRNNAEFPFNGRDFGIIIVGKAASGTEITDTETWLAAKTSGVTL